MARIALTARAEHNKGFFAEVDDEDYDALSRFRWYVRRVRGSRALYARRTRSRSEGGGTISMHQQILGIRDGVEIDHRDGNGLNNRRSNLRHLTHAGNIQAFHERRNEAAVDAWLIEQGVDPELNGEPCLTRRIRWHRRDCPGFRGIWRVSRRYHSDLAPKLAR